MNLLEYNMMLTEHFSLQEMLRSDLAIKYGIKNEPKTQEEAEEDRKSVV